jgi:hypothetical protein
MKLTNYCNLLGVLALAATFGACSSGSDGSGGGESGSLAIDNISVPSNAQWQINRPVAITFNSSSREACRSSASSPSPWMRTVWHAAM